MWGTRPSRVASSGTSCVCSQMALNPGKPSFSGRSEMWPRCSQPTSPDRGLEDRGSRAAGDQEKTLTPRRPPGTPERQGLPHPPGTRNGEQQTGRRGRPGSGGHVHVLPGHLWHPRSGEEAWQPAGGRWPYSWDRDLAQQVLRGILKRQAMRTGSGRHQSYETEWMPRRGHIPPGKAPSSLARDPTG